MKNRETCHNLSSPRNSRFMQYLTYMAWSMKHRALGGCPKTQHDVLREGTRAKRGT